jgi:membrane protease subunit (stomatin/prohibitin family)
MEKLMAENDSKKLNPQIRVFEFGIRELREMTIYPLSVADQFKLSDIIADAADKLAKKQVNVNTMKNKDFVKLFMELFRENANKIIKLVTDDSKTNDYLAELTNTQLVELGDLIYVMNYESAAKNFMGLLDRAKSLFLSKKSSQESADNMDTDLMIATESLSEKAA